MTQNHPAPASGVPLHKHGAFDDLGAALNSIGLLSRALRGVGKLLQPDMEHADEQLNMARRSDASAVFEFFGEALGAYSEIASEAADTLQREAVATSCLVNAKGGAE